MKILIPRQKKDLTQAQETSKPSSITSQQCQTYISSKKIEPNKTRITNTIYHNIQRALS